MDLGNSQRSQSDRGAVSSALPLDNAGKSWEVLAAHVEQFLENWEAAPEPPRVADHLPLIPGVLRRMVLIELIKVDLEFRQQNGPLVYRLEDYLADHPELAVPDGIPADLIYEEYHVRRNAGETVDVNEYLERFPDYADVLHRLFQLNSPTSSSSLTGSQLHAAYKPGDRIGDFYLMSGLGTGAFGSVFLARQESMQRMVALKVSSDRGSEAQTLAQLDHPHVVRVYDQLRMPEQNLRLLYMQFVPGGTLHSVIEASRLTDRKDSRLVTETIARSLQKTGVLSPEAAGNRAGTAARPWPEVVCRLGMELATALHYAHGHGILHRDVKPANVLLDVNGAAKLADFNISFSSHLEGTSPAAYFGGSLAYMSPEQLEACHPKHPTQATDLDGRSDVFSLGILLWEMLHGTRPYGDEAIVGSWCETLLAMAELRKSGPPAGTEAVKDDVELQLTRILHRCMAAAPEDRFQTADELACNLGLCLQPRVAALQHRSHQGWPGLANRWPLSSLILAAIGPNALAGVFNYVYNERAIINHLPGSKEPFERVQTVINLIAYPLGLIVGTIVVLPLLRALRATTDSVDSRLGTSSTDLSGIRQLALRFGQFMACLGLTEWVAAGLMYPLSLHLKVPGGLPGELWVHFFASLLVCGMVVAAYPFFLVSTLSIHAFFPALLRRDSLTDRDVEQLQQLGRSLDLFLYLSGGVPAAGVLLLMTAGHLEDSISRQALFVLSTLGAIGFGLTLALSRGLKLDIEALTESARLLSDIHRTAGHLPQRRDERAPSNP